MYKVNEIVLYGTNGVCKIKEISKRKIVGKEMEYYILEPVFSQASTLFVPTDNEMLVSKMRYVLSEKEIKEKLDKLSEKPEWIDNKNERLEFCKKTIADGNFDSVVDLVRMLRFREKEQNSKGKHLHLSDERLLKEAERMVFDEICMALNVDRINVLPMLLK